MSRPLFVIQPMCAQRQSCTECRGESDVYRKGWAARYTMPARWPDCPYGLPMGFTGPVPPVDITPMVLTPESPEAHATLERIKDRANLLRPICRKCEQFSGLASDGMGVNCKVGCTTCKGVLKPALVSFASGLCRIGKWKGIGDAS